MITAILARRRILLAKKSGKAPDMVLLINSPNTGDFSVTTRYGTFTAVKVSDYPYFDTTVTHKLSISDVTFYTDWRLSYDSAVSGLFVGVESWGTSNTYNNPSNLFYEFTSLRGIPSSWEGLGEVTYSNNMFRGCTSLESIPASWAGLGALITANNMFLGCTSLKGIPDSWEGLERLVNAGSFFQNCTSLTNCGTEFTGLVSVTSVSQLFNGCTGMLGDIHALYVYLSTKPIAVSEFMFCFRRCTQAEGYGSIPASWR